VSEQPLVSFSNLLPVRIIERLNRFVVAVELEGVVVRAHLPSSGRLKELVYLGNMGYVEKRSGNRKTEYTLILVESPEGNLVSLEANMASYFTFKALEQGLWADFADIKNLKKEVRVNDSRLDLFFHMKGLDWYAEVKSVTLVNDGIARFPDAPTLRGKKHIRELVELGKEGHRAAVIFIVGRGDALEFRPNWAMDWDFSQALYQAAKEGVVIKAYSMEVTLKGFFLGREIPINLMESNE